LVDLIDNEFINCGVPVKSEPIQTPAAIVRKIQKVKYLSKKERRWVLQLLMIATPFLSVVSVD